MVTGASSGIGWEFCIDLAKAGCRIIAAARRTDRLKALCDSINNLKIAGTHRSQGRDNDVQAVAVELDVSADGPTIKASVLKAWDAFGRIDALINNAGIRGNFGFFFIFSLCVRFIVYVRPSVVVVSRRVIGLTSTVSKLWLRDH